MALAIDASTPAKVTGTTSAIVTSSFSPPAASLLVAFVARNGPASNNDDGTVSSTGGLSWSLAGRKSKTVTSIGGAGTEACAEIWVAYAATAPGSITVTDTRADAATGSDRQHILKPVVVTGAEVTWAGAIAAAFSASGLPSVSLSTTRPNSWVFGVSSDWSAAGLGTADTGQTMIDEDNVVGQYSAHIWRQTSTTPASGTSVTMDLTAPSAEQYNELAIEIREPNTVTEFGSTSYTTANAATVTTASFTPANNTLLVAYCSMGNGAGTASSLGTVTDSLGGTWTRLTGDASATGGVAEIWCRDIGTGAAMTVTYDPGGSAASGLDIICKWYGGAALTASQPGATATLGGTTAYSTAITTTTTGSLVAGAYGRATDAQTVVANGSTTILGQVNGTSGDTAALFRATTTTGTPGSTTLGFTNAAAGANRMALAEILPTLAATGTAAAGACPPIVTPPGTIGPRKFLSPIVRGQLAARYQGTVSSSGPQSFSHSFDGSMSPTGALASLVTKPGFAGTVGPTGALTKRANKALAGTLTSSGSLVRTALKALAGTVASAGALAKAVTKPGLAGSSTPTGALAKQANKALSGILTSTGVLSTVKVVLRSFAGTLTSSGALARQANKALAGSASSAGTLTRQVAKALSGTITPSGALARRANKALSGTFTSSGALSTTKVVLRSFAGTLTSSGALAKQANKALAGSAASAGTMARQTQKALSGTATSSGALRKLAAKALAGTSTSNGALSTTKVVLRAFAGTMASSGTLTRQAAKALAGSVTPSGALARLAAKALAGVLASAGVLAKLARRLFAGSTTPTGAVTPTTVGATKNATSTSTVLESRTSAPGVAARDSSLPGVAGKATSTPSTASGRSSTPGVSRKASSNPSVSDG